MNRREMELIAGLAEGSLVDEAEARALVEFSAEAREAFESQKVAISALESLPPAELTESEKAALRRDLWTALTAPTGDTPSERRFLGQGQWAYVGAALFVVIGLFGAMTFLGGAADLSPVSAESDTAGAGPDSPPATTAAASERLFSLADQARTGVLSFSETFEDLSPAELDALHRCIAEAGVEGHEVMGGFSEAGVRYVVVVPEGTEIERDGPLALVDRDACRLAFSDD